MNEQNVHENVCKRAGVAALILEGGHLGSFVFSVKYIHEVK